jgi:hypothetical protein
MEDLLSWYFASSPLLNVNVSETRDVFEARAQRIFPFLLKNGFSNQDASLIYSIIGEVGNNTFDHNLGYWSDQPGCYFSYEFDKKGLNFAIADHGRGILASLKRVVDSLENDQQAVETAFNQIVSGRAPEQRGNGLKFVRQIIMGAPKRALFAHSGNGFLIIGRKKFTSVINEKFKPEDFPKGTLIWVRWEHT